MWDTEVKLNTHSSYYFRLTTMDRLLARELHASGCEASYHYEELSTLIKVKGINNRQGALKELDNARAAFRQNLYELRNTIGVPMRSVAAHGDFANRKLRICNTLILQDSVLRMEAGIDVEAYDNWPSLEVRRHSDVTREYPRVWQEEGGPNVSFLKAVPVIHLLVHPEGWVRSITQNVLDDVNRVRESIKYTHAIRMRKA